MSVSPADVERAREVLAGRIHRTPTFGSASLGVSLKAELFQKTGSFKVRGALAKISTLDADARARGVVTFSAGNHAQAVAWAARAAGIHAVVVMPERASQTKAAASRGYGAEVVLYGASGLEALDRAHALERERGLVFLHPFDDEVVCSGAGTTGLELMEQVPDLDAVVVPIGGGGLISGIAVAVKEISPRTRVYGVEPTGAPAMRRSLDAGHPVQLDSVRTIADGLAAPMAGQVNYEIVRRYVDDVVLIDDETIAEGLRELLASTKLLAEGGGAAATAAVLARAIPFPQGARVAAIVSGGNIDLDKLATLLR